jgi:hypothetical protein
VLVASGVGVFIKKSAGEFLGLFGIHHSTGTTYISGTGTAGTDGTAMMVVSRTFPANELVQVGDRVRIRVYWSGDTGAPITGTTYLNSVPIANTTDGGGATLQLNEVWLHYIDNTHANIIENEGGALGALSAPNVAGFLWDTDQALEIGQDNIANNHIIVYALIIDHFPKGLVH